MPPGCSGERCGEGLRGDACTQVTACLGMGLGICLGTPLSHACQDRLLAFLLGAQGRCRGVWERLARKLLGVCLSCGTSPN